MDITDKFLNELIIAPKRITKKPGKDYQIVNGSKRKSFTVFSDKYEQRFTVFVRQPLILPECFSIGLIWMCEELDENPILFRCNGPHGGNEKITEHFVPHIHKFKLQTLDDELYSIEKTIEATTGYSTFDGALYYFLTTCNILDAEQYFPTAYEISLFDS